MPSGEPLLRCDFCGRAVPRVRRVALDAGYDRLSRAHVARFACEPCSKRKDAERRASTSGAATKSSG